MKAKEDKLYAAYTAAYAKYITASLKIASVLYDAAVSEVAAARALYAQGAATSAAFNTADVQAAVDKARKAAYKAATAADAYARATRNRRC